MDREREGEGGGRRKREVGEKRETKLFILFDGCSLSILLFKGFHLLGIPIFMVQRYPYTSRFK